MVKSEARSLRMGSFPARRAPVPERTLIIGITGDGYVPVIEDPVVDAAGPGWGRSVIRFPSVVLDTAGRRSTDPREEALSQLLRKFGYEAEELLPMETKGPPGFLLAPLLRNTGRPRTGFDPGVYEVPLRQIPEWLCHRRRAGAIESPHLRRGLALAREFFPRWARVRLCGAIDEIEAQRARRRA